MRHLRLPALDEYAKQFREKFGREMTIEERRFYELTARLLNEADDQDQSKSA